MAENDIVAFKELASGGFVEVAVASTTTPAALGTPAVGTGATFARADHVHAMPTAANVGAAQAVTEIELVVGTNTITTAQLPARGIAFSDGEATFTVNLPTPDIRESGLTFSIKSQYEAGSGPNYITVVHAAVNLLTTVVLDEDEGSIDFVWNGYAWTYDSAYLLRSFPGRVLALPVKSGTIALTEPVDSVFRVVGSSDATKKLAFEVDTLVSTATTRVLTVPNSSGTIALTETFAAPPAIGNTTPNSGSFTTLAANNGAPTASAPVLDLSQTWNASGVTFTGLRFNATNTASAAASLLADFQVGATSQFKIDKTGNVTVPASAGYTAGLGRWYDNGAGGFVASLSGLDKIRMLASLDYFIFSATTSLTWGSSGVGGVDLIVARDAADTLAQRRLANPQAFRLYNTTDAGLTNYERGFMRWSSNVFQIGTEKGGTGSARNLEFHYDGMAALRLYSQGVNIRQSAILGFSSNGITGVDVSLFRPSAGVISIGDNSTNNPPALRIHNQFNSTEYAALRWASNEFIFDANAGSGTLRGIKLGSAATSLLGFFGATPVVQQAAVADATDAASTQARLNDLLARVRTLGLIAT